MSRKKTQDEFVFEVEHNNDKVRVVGCYDGLHKKVDCECVFCNTVFQMFGIDAIHGKGHASCSNKRAGENKRKTNEQFLKELHEITTTIIPLEPYIRALDSINVMCIECGRVFPVTPHSILQGRGCSVCNKKKAGLLNRKPHEKFVEEMENIHPELIVKSTYETSWVKVTCECLNCGNIFESFPADLLDGKGCSMCARMRTTLASIKPFEQFREEVYDVNPDIIITGCYTKQSEHIDVKCKICGHEWSPFGGSLIYGTGCPICKSSHGERSIRNYLLANDIEFIPQKKYDNLVGLGGGQLSYDFYIPSFNILIEYQGEYHDGTANNQTEDEFMKQQVHDKLKKEYAKNNGINLLEIWYWDFKNIDTILNSKLQ